MKQSFALPLLVLALAAWRPVEAAPGAPLAKPASPASQPKSLATGPARLAPGHRRACAAVGERLARLQKRLKADEAASALAKELAAVRAVLDRVLAEAHVSPTHPDVAGLLRRLARCERLLAGPEPEPLADRLSARAGDELAKVRALLRQGYKKAVFENDAPGARTVLARAAAVLAQAVKQHRLDRRREPVASIAAKLAELTASVGPAPAPTTQPAPGKRK